MKKIIPLLILLALFSLKPFAQELSPKAKLIKHVYDKLVKQPGTPFLQIKYIDVFPNNRNEFIDIFNDYDGEQLTEGGVNYVRVFRKLGKDFPDSVLRKSILIGKDLKTWSSGPVSELQKGIYYTTNKNPQLFINYTSELKKDEQMGLAKFLYWGKEGKNINYDALLSIIKSSGLKKMYKVFTEAEKQADNNE